jgi:DNA polymerase-4
MEFLLKFTPIMEPTSIDEAYLDITLSQNLYGGPVQTARKIKDVIIDKLGLTCSIGISENKLLAKTASDMNKPDGLTTLYKSELEEKFFPLKIRKLRGVGPQTEEVLHKWGIYTIRDLAQYPQDKLEKTFGVYGIQLNQKARGEDDSPVVPIEDAPEEKSISNEHTLHEDSSDLMFVRSLLMTLSDKVASRMKKAGFRARTVRLKLRYSDFKTITREKTLEKYTDNPETIYAVTSSLIPEKDAISKQVRLIGAGVTNLKKISESPQYDLFGDAEVSRRSAANNTVEKIRDKHGRFSIVRAVSLPFRWDH